MSVFRHWKSLFWSPRVDLNTARSLIKWCILDLAIYGDPIFLRVAQVLGLPIITRITGATVLGTTYCSAQLVGVYGTSLLKGTAVQFKLQSPKITEKTSHLTYFQERRQFFFFLFLFSSVRK